MAAEEDALLSVEDQSRIADAVARAERGTAGEIRVVLSTRPLIDHATHALLWAAVIALLAPWPLAFLLPLDVAKLLAVQGIFFLVLGALLALTPLGRRCVPAALERAAARHAALDHFLSFGIHQTRHRTGVLILIALPEHRVEVVADEAIHAKVGTAAWEDVCARVLVGAREGRLVDGIEAGVAEAGRLLALHIPPAPGDTDELPNRPLVV
ncbi:TPM domain-containing protein [Ancylobacter sp. SL191]|uniref:TPM domain-containing protein n=1 Tax=Ancylobacter sp. SL191 TaxID=2995166 RepID=UPI00227026E2|nr:hypothetical protein [Ancylobacter sp. SL191]WAC25763.1 hypothetical protein OU996_12055 [Ancylobacter sp. SL191]